MDARTREETRKVTSQRRIRPLKPHRLFFGAGGLGVCPPAIHAEGPVELHVEATDANGAVVPWLTDEWWIEVQRLCGRRPVTVVILPTPGALLNSVILHQLEMIRRIAPDWHLVGYARAMEAQREPNMERWVRTPFEEIRFCEESHPPKPAESFGGAGAGSAARRLAAQASALPRVPGWRHAQIRVIAAMPDPLPGGMSPPAGQLPAGPYSDPEPAATDDGCTAAGAVKSPAWL